MGFFFQNSGKSNALKRKIIFFVIFLLLAMITTLIFMGQRTTKKKTPLDEMLTEEEKTMLVSLAAKGSINLSLPLPTGPGAKELIMGCLLGTHYQDPYTGRIYPYPKQAEESTAIRLIKEMNERMNRLEKDSLSNGEDQNDLFPEKDPQSTAQPNSNPQPNPAETESFSASTGSGGGGENEYKEETSWPLLLNPESASGEVKKGEQTKGVGTKEEDVPQEPESED